MRLRGRCRMMFLVVGLSVLGPFAASAGADQALGVTLFQTYLKTSDVFVNLNQGGSEAPSPRQRRYARFFLC